MGRRAKARVVIGARVVVVNRGAHGTNVQLRGRRTERDAVPWRTQSTIDDVSSEHDIDCNISKLRTCRC